MKLYNRDGKEIPYVDWRLPENRMKSFLLWLDWRLNYFDLDHYGCNNSYRDTLYSPTKKKMTFEQSVWFSLIFGMTYQSEMAWVIYWNFPNFHEIDLPYLIEWNSKNIDRQKYAKDTKYNKGRIVEQVYSMRDIVGPSLVDWSKKLTNFESAYEEVMKFHKFGRMTTWICLQTLHETAGINLNPKTCLASDDSSWSVREGLYFLFNRDVPEKLTESEKSWIVERELELYETCMNFISEDNKKVFSNFLLESHLCQYKKLMKGGDYPGHSSGDHVSRANWLSEKWPEVDFRCFYEEILPLHHPLIRGKMETKSYRDICSETGIMINMHEDYDFMPKYEENNLESLM